ncbi:MAG TPA: hypothetical protein VF079_01975 [Sphingomicrobium sp.]
MLLILPVAPPTGAGDVWKVKRAILLGLLLIASSAAYARARTWPCYWVHGRMTDGNGTPSLRIWPSGTHRMLGVVSLRRSTPDDPDPADIPNYVRNRLRYENNFTVWGDFYVCPVAPERAGWMRFVLVKKARKLFVPRT